MIRDRWNMNLALWGVAVLMVVAGALWFWGAKYLPAIPMRSKRLVVALRLRTFLIPNRNPIP
jgi:hypothetical protein